MRPLKTVSTYLEAPHTCSTATRFLNLLALGYTKGRIGLLLAQGTGHQSTLTAGITRNASDTQPRWRCTPRALAPAALWPGSQLEGKLLLEAGGSLVVAGARLLGRGRSHLGSSRPEEPERRRRLEEIEDGRYGTQHGGTAVARLARVDHHHLHVCPTVLQAWQVQYSFRCSQCSICFTGTRGCVCAQQAGALWVTVMAAARAHAMSRRRGRRCLAHHAGVQPGKEGCLPQEGVPRGGLGECGGCNALPEEQEQENGRKVLRAARRPQDVCGRGGGGGACAGAGSMCFGFSLPRRWPPCRLAYPPGPQRGRG